MLQMEYIYLFQLQDIQLNEEVPENDGSFRALVCRAHIRETYPPSHQQVLETGMVPTTSATP